MTFTKHRLNIADKHSILIVVCESHVSVKIGMVAQNYSLHGVPVRTGEGNCKTHIVTSLALQTLNLGHGLARETT